MSQSFRAGQNGEWVEDMEGIALQTLKLTGDSYIIVCDRTERSRPILPDQVRKVPISSHLNAQQSSISTMRSSAHKVIHYAQGERLAWDEMNKWVGWERERVEALNTELDEQPYTARTFDPLLLIEFVQRDFECPELRWLLLGMKTKANTELLAEGKGDDSEESFVKANGAEDTPTSEDKTTTEAVLMQLDLEDRRSALPDERSRSSSKGRLKSTLRWLQDEPSFHQIPANSPTRSAPNVYRDEPPRLLQAEIVPNRRDSMYTDVPLATRLRHIVKALKAIFEGLPTRLSGLEAVTETVSLPLRQRWSRQCDDRTTAQDGIVSLPSGSSRQGTGAPLASSAEAEQEEHLLTSMAHLTRSIAYVDATTGETIYQVIVGSPDRRTLLCIRVPKSGESGLGSIVEMSLDFESFELLGYDRLLVVAKHEASAPSTHGRALECIDLDGVFEGSAQTINEYVSNADSSSSGTMPPSVVLLRQTVSRDENRSADDGEGNDKDKADVTHQLAVSSGRNIAAILSRSRQKGTAAGPVEQQQPAWTGQKVEFWDVVAAEEDEESNDDDGMSG